MIDQIIIDDKASFDDFGASVAERELRQPEKKIIKETVPFSNITYDFTAINGEIYWQERELEYIFEITATTAERLEELKTAFAGWVMNVMQRPLHDPIIPDYHFIATYEDMSFDDDEGLEKTTASVTFTAYPYKIANHASEYEFKIPIHDPVIYEYTEVWIMNNSSHRISPTISVTGVLGELNVTLNGVSMHTSFKDVTWKDDSLKLNTGANAVRIANYGSSSVTMVVSFHEEVF